MNIVVFSGGTATNSLTPCFNNLSINKGHQLTYVLPISDNGGSTSEILRIMGGPAIGDIRSRIVRLIEDKQLASVFAYRLPNDKKRAKQEWNEIVDGSHPIWNNVCIEVKEMCRAFIIHVQSELLKKSKTTNGFQFEMASVGNFFLTGARLFLGNLDASIELMMRIGRCDSNLRVIPCIRTSHTHHISALLANGDIITGQSQISHPSKQPVASSRGSNQEFVHIITEDEHGKDKKGTIVNVVQEEEFEEEYANPTYILPELKNSQLHFDKGCEDDRLPAAIKRIFYINPYGEEIKPTGNPRAVSKIKKADMVVYSIGSLMTSLLPILVLGNVADTILTTDNIRKVLIINNKYDRETFSLDGILYLKMIIDSMSRAAITYRQSKGITISNLKIIPWDKFVTDIVYLKQGEIQMDWEELSNHNIVCHSIDSDRLENDTLEHVLSEINIGKN